MRDVRMNDGMQERVEKGVDWLLAHFVALAEKGLEIGVTLNVGGQEISGHLIGVKSYFERLGAILEKSEFAGLDKEFPASIGKSIADFGGVHTAGPTFIHLREALYFLEGRPLTAGGVLWRGKLSAIDGFSLGNTIPNK